jgi:hypothetical protein
VRGPAGGRPTRRATTRATPETDCFRPIALARRARFEANLLPDFAFYRLIIGISRATKPRFYRFYRLQLGSLYFYSHLYRTKVSMALIGSVPSKPHGETQLTTGGLAMNELECISGVLSISITLPQIIYRGLRPSALLNSWLVDIMLQTAWTKRRSSLFPFPSCLSCHLGDFVSRLSSRIDSR